MQHDLSLLSAIQKLESAHFEVKKMVPLREKLTLKTAAVAHFLIILSTQEQLQKFSDLIRPFWGHIPVLILGGGSNMVLKSDFLGLVVQIANKGISKEIKNDETVVTVQSGENWSDLVDWTCSQDLWGIENLALIPGSVGAAPIQNIGAYGTELKDTFHSLKALHVPSGTWKTFSIDDCHFDYRESFFKSKPGKDYIISSVSLRLSKTPNANIKYPDLQKVLNSEEKLTPSAIAEKVKQIRREKLPDPSILGNVGSFFKNPLVSSEKLIHLQKKYPDIVYFKNSDGMVKIPAAWLIDKAGWKGYRSGEIGVHERQALVLVNFGQARGEEILELAFKIQNDIADKFDINLEIEPSII